MSDDLVKQLREPAFGTETTERNLMNKAADRIEELVATCELLEAKLQNQTYLIEQLFALLDKTEETDDGIVFHPNQLRSCRATDTEKLNKILADLKGNNT